MKTLFSSLRALRAGVSTRGWALVSTSLLALFIVLHTNAWGQSNQLETQQGLLNAIAPYNASQRQAMLTASQYPQVLTDIQKAQETSRSSFEALINGFSQNKQGWFYDLTRYSDLMHQLAQLPKGTTEDAVKQLAPASEPAVQEAAWRLYRHHNDDLIKADNLNQQANQTFEKLIGNLDANTQTAFRQLLAYPDALVLLTNNSDLTAQLGQQYAANTSDISGQLATLHDKLAADHESEVAAYRKQLDADPQASQELKQAAQTYAQANGFLLPNGTYSGNLMYANPYSFWFGYPYWYGTALWYPGAYWGGFGLTYGLGTFGMYGFPAFGFNNWFFNGGYAGYPHLYTRLNGYYRTVAPMHRFSPANRAFMNAADAHFGTLSGTHMNRFSPGRPTTFPGGSFGSRSFGGGGFGGARSFGGHRR
ncbi:hypothetical protein GCM10028807_42510 [Spirosoma daeguense]